MLLHWFSLATDWWLLLLQLRTLTIYFSLDHKPQSHKWNWNKLKHSDSFNSDSIELKTLLTTLISDFLTVVSAVTNLTTTQTLTSEKQSLTLTHKDTNNSWLFFQFFTFTCSVSHATLLLRVHVHIFKYGGPNEDEVYSVMTTLTSNRSAIWATRHTGDEGNILPSPTKLPWNEIGIQGVHYL